MDQEPLGTLLRALRKRAAISQEQLAERAHISARTIGDIESGFQVRPRRDTLAAIFDALQASAQERTDVLAAAARLQRESRIVAEHDFASYGSSFIGREDDLAGIVALIKGGAKSITLIGPGGVGKTRLAYEVARGLAGARRAYFIELDQIRDDEGMMAAFARVLGSADAVDPGRFVIGALYGFPALVVADNVEQLPAAGRALDALLSALPELVVIATSRTPLGTRDERRWAVEPLARDAAIALLTERIRAAFPAFNSAAASDDLAAIADRLDRLPLAIELVAPRARVFSAAQLRERLSSRLGLLVGGAPEGPVRHRTLRDTIAWSYELLASAEQRMLMTLAGLGGHVSLAEAERAWPTGDAHVLIESLLEKNLLVRCDHADGTPHFGMLGTIAEFAREVAEAPP